MKRIPLSQGKFAIVDDEDFEELSKFKWFVGGTEYAARNIHTPGRSPSAVLMHRVIAKTPHGMYTDHVNRDKLDNRRSNLRVCTQSENMYNKIIQSNSTTGFKGVNECKDKRVKRFRASLRAAKKTFHLGHFKTPEEAFAPYCKAAREHFGEFARFA